MIEDTSREKEYLGGGSRSEIKDKARPKIPVVEEYPTVDECPINEVCKEKDKNDKDRATLLLWKYLKNLVTIPTGQSLQDRLTELKEKKPACAYFESAIHHPLKIVEDRFKFMSIDGRSVVVKPYPK